MKSPRLTTLRKQICDRAGDQVTLIRKSRRSQRQRFFEINFLVKAETAEGGAIAALTRKFLSKFVWPLRSTAPSDRICAKLI
jgi:hypothetical protein